MSQTAHALQDTGSIISVVNISKVYTCFLCKKNQLDALISQIYFGMKLYTFQTVPLSITSLFAVHSAMVYVIQVCRQLLSRSICFCLTAVYKPVWHIPLLSVQRINSWWWTEALSETCRVSCQNKFGKLVHLVGFSYKENLLRCTVTWT